MSWNASRGRMVKRPRVQGRPLSFGFAPRALAARREEVAIAIAAHREAGTPHLGLFLDATSRPFPEDLQEIEPPVVVASRGGIVTAAVRPNGLVQYDPRIGAPVNTISPDEIWTMAATEDGQSVVYGRPRPTTLENGDRAVLPQLVFARAQDNFRPKPLPVREGEAQLNGAFLPGGQEIAFTGWPGELRFYDVATGDVRSLAAPLNHVNVMKPVIAPDGKIAVMRTNDYQTGSLLVLADKFGSSCVEVPTPRAHDCLVPFAFSPDSRFLLVRHANPDGFRTLGVIDLDANKKTVLPVGPQNQDVVEAVWGNTGIFFVRSIEGRTRLFHLEGISLSEVAREPLEPTGSIQHLSLSPDGQTLAYLRSWSNRPYELYEYNVAEGVQTQLTRLSQMTAPPDSFSVAEPYEVRSSDGLTIHGLFHPPRNALWGAPSPAVVMPHGGPPSQDLDEFNPWVQLFTTNGIAVLQTRFRGSTGGGVGLEYAGIGDWGGGDVRDLQASARLFIANGLIDPMRLGVTGHSYGGYLSLMPPADDPDFYKARAALSAPTDLLYQYRRQKRLRPILRRGLGSPYSSEGRRHYLERSPVAHVDTLRRHPLLLVHGDEDENVPPQNSWMLWDAIRVTDHAELRILSSSIAGHSYPPIGMLLIANTVLSFMLWHLVGEHLEADHSYSRVARSRWLGSPAMETYLDMAQRLHF